MGIVRVKEFEEEFEQEEIEIYALLREAPNGAAAYLKDYLRPLVYTEATVDCKTGVLDRREGIYRLLVRKAKIKILDENRVASWNNRYLVLKVLEWDAGQKELEALAAYLQQPKYIHTQRGDFLLNRQYKWYEMKTPDCGFTLDADEGSDETCEAALATYKKHEMNMPELDRQLRAYAAGHMLDTANDWLGDADEEPITAEQFADRITLSELAFRNDGSIEAYYDDGDIFWGHCIIVRMDKNGNIEDAEIAG
jgi:hypothetical protein